MFTLSAEERTFILEVLGNTVEISGGTIEGMVLGRYSELGDTTGNTVTLKQNTVVGNVYSGSTGQPNTDAFTS